MKYLHDHDAFVEALNIWRSKSMALSGFDVHAFPDGTHEPVVMDYFDPDIAYLSKGGPYKTWRGAFAAIGAAFDQADREESGKEVGV